MSESTFVVCLLILTVLVHLVLLFFRGWMINQLRREQRKMRTEWEGFKFEQDQWKTHFEEEHRSPWLTPIKRNAS